MECTCIDCPRIGQMTLHDLNAIHPHITFVNKSNGTMIFPEWNYHNKHDYVSFV